MPLSTAVRARLLLSGVIVLHLGALAAFWVGVSTVAVTTCLALGVARALGITLGFHRYFAHRSFRTGRGMQFVLALAGSLAGQGGPLWWVSHHRDHHANADGPKDLHSPVAHGFWRGHIGWLLQPAALRRGAAQVRDLERFPELEFLERRYGWIMFGQGALLFGIGAALAHWQPQLGTSGVQMLVWGLFVSITLLLHVTFAVNSVCHRWGAQPHATGDGSRNNALIGVLAMGEGWHNNHHAFPYSARHGLRWWQIDVSWWILRVFAGVGLVTDLKLPRESTPG